MATPRWVPAALLISAALGAVVALLGWTAIAALDLWRSVGLAPAQRAERAAIASADMEAAAIRAVQARLRAPEVVELHDLTIHRFGPEDELAVCGRIVPRRDVDRAATAAALPAGGGAPGEASSGFVARVLLPRRDAEGGSGGAARPDRRPLLVVMEDAPGLWRGGRPGAPRRRFCHDAPPPGAATAAATAAASPDAHAAGDRPAPSPFGPALGGAEAEAPPSALPPPVAEGGGRPPPPPPLPRMIARSPANLRAEPSGGAPVLRVAPRGEAFGVYGQAPGGWFRVGDGTGPEGWIHGSLLSQEASPPPRGIGP